MELNEFITKSLSNIIQGMRNFQDIENKRVPPGGHEASPEKWDEGASVFPELSAESKDLQSVGLLKAAEVEGFKGRSTIMAINYDVLLTVTNEGIGVVEGSAKALGFFNFSAKAEAKKMREAQHRMTFAIPLNLPLPSRQIKDKKHGIPVPKEIYGPLIYE